MLISRFHGTRPPPLELYSLRHAKAEERGPKYSDDSRRPLTKEGIELQKEACRGMKVLKVEFDLVLSSPFVRAKQTAEVVSRCLRTKPPRFSRNLSAGGDARRLVDELRKRYPNARSVLLVGHEPDLSSLIAKLSGGSDRSAISFKKSGMCLLKIEKREELRFGRCGSIEWILTPKQLRLLGKR